MKKKALIQPPICVCTPQKASCELRLTLLLLTAEEIKDASRTLPLAMMGTALLNGALGYIMLISYLICMGDVQEVMDTPTGFPFIQVFFNSTGSHAGASVMTAILIILCMCGTISNVATASRQLFAFARDNGVPFSGFLAYVRFLENSYSSSHPLVALLHC